MTACGFMWVSTSWLGAESSWKSCCHWEKKKKHLNDSETPKLFLKITPDKLSETVFVGGETDT